MVCVDMFLPLEWKDSKRNGMGKETEELTEKFQRILKYYLHPKKDIVFTHKFSETPDEMMDN